MIQQGGKTAAGPEKEALADNHSPFFHKMQGI